MFTPINPPKPEKQDQNKRIKTCVIIPISGMSNATPITNSTDSTTEKKAKFKNII